MADSTISNLPVATIIDSVNDVVPVVHKGVTQKVSLQNLVSSVFDSGYVGNGVKKYNNVSEIATPFDGVAQVGHSLYTGNNDNPLEIPYLNSNSELVANIIPRTGTLSTLLSVIGSQGELASSTDEAAIVQFLGNGAVGGNVYRPSVINNPPFGALPATFGNLNNSLLTASYTNIIDFLSFSNFYLPSTTLRSLPLTGFSSTTGLIQASFDMMNYFQIDAPSIASIYATDGDTIIGVPINVSTTVIFYTYQATYNYGTWLTIAVPSAVYDRPIALGNNAILIKPVGSTNLSYVVNTASHLNTLIPVSLPSTDSWVLPVSLQGYLYNSHVLAITYIPSTNNIAVLSGSTSISLTWVLYSVPFTLGLVSEVKIAITKRAICILSGNTFQYCSYTLDTLTGVVTLSQFKISTNVITSSNLVSNLYYFFTSSSTPQYSVDGNTWFNLDVSPSPNIVPVSDGCLLKYTDYVLHAACGNNYSITPTSTNDMTKALGNFVIDRGRIRLLAFGTSLPIRQPRVTGSALTGIINIAEGTTVANITTVTQTALTINLPPNCSLNSTVEIYFANSHTNVTFGTQPAPANQLIRGASTYVLASVPAYTSLVFTFTTALTWIVR